MSDRMARVLLTAIDMPEVDAESFLSGVEAAVDGREAMGNEAFMNGYRAAYAALEEMTARSTDLEH